jgi:hypothetical protein
VETLQELNVRKQTGELVEVPVRWQFLKKSMKIGSSLALDRADARRKA